MKTPFGDKTFRIPLYQPVQMIDIGNHVVSDDIGGSLFAL